MLSFVDLIVRLPLEIAFYTLKNFLTLSERLEFSKVNRIISSLFLKGVREIYLKSASLEKFCKVETFRHQILNLLQQPTHQLYGRLVKSWKLNSNPFLHYSSFKKISISANHLFNLCSNYIEQLEVFWEGINQSLEEILQANEFLNIKDVIHLTYHDYNLNVLPILPKLQNLVLITCPSLTTENLVISQYRNLRSLTLRRCHQIVDVTRLAHIYELRLEDCNGIEDISSLNYNHIISIWGCNNIVDYSCSFQFSKIIDLTIRSEKPFHPIDIDHLQKVQKLRINGYLQINGQPYMKYKKDFPSCLKSFWICNCNCIIIIPKNHLQEIHIERCPSFITSPSFSNINEVPVVKLINLIIPSLEGLTSKNRFIVIGGCSKIENFSPIKDCEFVSINECKHFIDAGIFSSSKELQVTPYDDSFRFQESSARWITHLSLENITNLTDSFMSHNFVRIKEIILSSAFVNSDAELPLFQELSQNQSLQKISIYLQNPTSPKIQFQLQQLLPYYDIQYLPLEREVILLPKNRRL